MYQERRRETLQVSLAHGFATQAQYELFENQYLVYPCRRTRVSFARFCLEGCRWMRAHAREFDIVHGLSGYHYSVRPLYEACKLGVKTVLFITLAGEDLADKGNLSTRLGFPARRRRMAREFDAIVAMSTEIREELLGYGFPPDRVYTIPNAADTRRFFPAKDAAEKALLRRKLGWRDVPTIVFVGQICPRKRPHLLVDAIERLRNSGWDAQLVLAGPEDGSDYARKLRERCAQGDLSPRVLRVGFRSDIEVVMRAADLFALPSESEGMPGAMIEALATGLPSLVTDFSSAKDVIDQDTLGEIVPPDGEAIADAFRRRMADATALKRSALDCRRRAEERYSSAAVFQAHESLFRRLLGRTGL
jgi:glycosyltransferase involved in cell wall biosynthesis